ncbi:RNA polymerase subunit sigma [Egibacter rhizosphaerae]|uniref:protein acetyllysine N-acetyltransferase n=1 Tax=Egibacter rhizosphaerae TaxID=1670831 RepID=A0A411YIN9_9ACTN|nr:Sir2 family NAD-dependent protein deacetylase [Egibacter rhizosphaerae]QBI20942.1 RNA polymerase subunit sigma [Egibacter rhizosphaerae]
MWGSEVIDREIAGLVDRSVAEDGLVVVLTGAGVSAESGIPTFRGPEGYWTVGSAVHTPQEIATAAMFARAPEAVWGWYLFRLGVVREAEPNAAHRAIAELDATLSDRFVLITQNVDGLHQRAGSTPGRTYEIHGSLGRMRCSEPCQRELLPLPDEIPAKDRDEALTDHERQLLTCPRCGAWTRPHVLWFDEAYDEAWFRLDSSLDAAGRASLVVTVGTSGATNLPNLVVQQVVRSGGALLDVNPEDNPFGDLARRVERGAAIRAPASQAVPELADRIAVAASAPR